MERSAPPRDETQMRPAGGGGGGGGEEGGAEGGRGEFMVEAAVAAPGVKLLTQPASLFLSLPLPPSLYAHMCTYRRVSCRGRITACVARMALPLST